MCFTITPKTYYILGARGNNNNEKTSQKLGQGHDKRVSQPLLISLHWLRHLLGLALSKGFIRFLTDLPKSEDPYNNVIFCHYISVSYRLTFWHSRFGARTRAGSK